MFFPAIEFFVFFRELRSFFHDFLVVPEPSTEGSIVFEGDFNQPGFMGLSIGSIAAAIPSPEFFHHSILPTFHCPNPDFSQGGPQRTNLRNDHSSLPKFGPVNTFDTSSYSFFGNTWLRFSGEPS